MGAYIPFNGRSIVHAVPNGCAACNGHPDIHPHPSCGAFRTRAELDAEIARLRLSPFSRFIRGKGA